MTLPLSAMDSTKTPGMDSQKTTLKRATDDFESVFLYQMLKEMRQTIDDSQGLFAKSDAEKTFEGLLDQQLAADMGRRQGLGLGDILYKQLEKYIEE